MRIEHVWYRSVFIELEEIYRSFKRDNHLVTMTFKSLATILERKEHQAKMNNLSNHHGAGPLRRGAQCSCIGCIGLRPALYIWILLVTFSKNRSFGMSLSTRASRLLHECCENDTICVLKAAKLVLLWLRFSINDSELLVPSGGSSNQTAMFVSS